MKLEDLLRMAFNDGKRYGQGNTNLNFKQHFESTEYFEAIKLVKNCSIPDVVLQSEQLVCNCQGCAEVKKIEYCENCYAENLSDLAN